MLITLIMSVLSVAVGLTTLTARTTLTIHRQWVG